VNEATVRMLVIIAVLFAAMKLLVTVLWCARTGRRIAPLRFLAFAAWPGMDLAPFADDRPSSRAADGRLRPLLVNGAAAIAAGAGLLGLARTLFPSLLATAAALAGLSLILHFGLFSLVAAFWRAQGFAVEPVFESPHRARSLSEFWGRRWNRGFSEMTASIVYGPVARRRRPLAALLAGFAFSGVLHELAVSLPVGAGFGGPLAYFLLHGLLVALERTPRGRTWIARHPRGARLWIAAALVLPLPLLFHRPFLAGIVWPLVTP